MAHIIKAHELTEPPLPWQPDEPAPESDGIAQGSGDIPTETSHPIVAAAPEDLGAAEEEARRRGLDQGIRAAEEAYRAKLARLDSLTAALQHERDSFFARIEPELVRLSASIAEKIIQRELEACPDTVVQLVAGAMKRIRDRETLRLSVNPRDFDQIKQARDDLISAMDGIRKLDIVEDRRVDPGGCLIESPDGTLDARITTQMAQITSALTDVMPDPPPEVAGDEAAGGEAHDGPDTLPTSD